MKKTILTLALCAVSAISGTVMADDSSLTATNITIAQTGASDKYAGMSGVIMQLTDTKFTGNTNLTETVKLNSVTITTRNQHNSEPTVGSLVAIAVYEQPAAGSSDKLGAFVGLSTGAAYQRETDLTFNFNGEVLKSDATYYFMFVTGATTAAQLDGAGYDGFSAQAATMAAKVDSTTGTSKLISDKSTLGTVDYVPTLSVNVTTVPPTQSSSDTVPEPATATLSLLALAGLAARRRRK